jgi:hypothetical protein
MILMALCAFFISCEPLAKPDPWVTIFSDDFNRPDSDVVGNGWNEVDLGGIPPANASISGQALLMTGGNTTPTYMALVRSGSIEGDFRIAFSFTFSDAVLARVLVSIATPDMDADSGWYAMGYLPDHLGAWNAQTALPGSVNAALDPSHSFSMEIRRDGEEITVVPTDTTVDAAWTAIANDSSYHDFNAIHLKAGDYDTGPVSVLVDDFAVQTR